MIRRLRRPASGINAGLGRLLVALAAVGVLLSAFIRLI